MDDDRAEIPPAAGPFRAEPWRSARAHLQDRRRPTASAAAAAACDADGSTPQVTPGWGARPRPGGSSVAGVETPRGRAPRTLAQDVLALVDQVAASTRRLWPGHPPGIVDIALVLLLAVAGIPFMTQSQRAYEDPFWGFVAFVCVVLFSVPFLWRRSNPMVVALVVTLPHLVQLVLLTEPTPANVSVPIAVYSVARWSRDWRVRRLALLLVGVGSVLAGVRWSGPFLVDPAPAEVLFRVVVITTLCLATTVPAWLLGALVRQRAEAREETRQRALAVERGRVQSVRLAAQEERARIAREMHDVVAHSLSVIVVQSDGAAYALDSAIERAKAGEDVQVVADALRNASTVLQTIGRTARESLADTRRLVAVLRQDEPDAEYAPTGGVDSLGDLIDPLRAAGLEITTDVTGRARPLSRAADLAVYRVVQEALTNVIKHAGEARVWVSLDYLPEALLLTVRDDGAGVTAPPDGHGHGLVGMQERLAAVDGRLWAGGAPGGGFVVEARIPYDAVATHDV